MATLYLRIDLRTEVACSRILSAFGAGSDPTSAPPPEQIVARIRDELGGEYATSRVPEGHTGTCALFYRGRFGQHCAIFPSYRQAAAAARMAIDPTIGGYGDVRIDLGVKAPPEAELFVTASDWLA